MLNFDLFCYLTTDQHIIDRKALLDGGSRFTSMLQVRLY
jgi:hypothetical protein